MNGSNITSKADNVCILERKSFETAKLALVIVFGGFGLVGNTFIIVLAAKYTERKKIHYLIINMAVSDILVALMFSLTLIDFSLPNNSPQTLADITCKTYGCVEYISELVTLTSLFIISTERYRATRVTLDDPIYSSRFLTIAIWLASFLLSCYRVVVMHASQPSPKHPFTCEDKSYSTGACRGFFLLRSTCIIFLYCVVLVLSLITSKKIFRVHPIQGNLSNEQRRFRERRIIQAIKLVLCSLLLYSLCYLPDFLEDLIKGINPSIFSGMIESCKELLDFLLQIPKVVNSSFSPIVYLLLLPDFKRAAKNLILRHNNQ